MINHPSCPVCDRYQWRSLGSKTYRLADWDKLSLYTQHRYRVLFELWFPGEEEVTITSRLCESCGFVLYTPRPTAEELDAKYRYRNPLGPGAAGPAPSNPVELKRAQLLYRRCKRYLPHNRPTRILDFGGGDGRLMREFVARGRGCEIVDYSGDTVAGVQKVGDTLADLPAPASYDWIVCSHVIEHVADPRNVLAALGQRLNDTACYTLRCQMEIWNGAPLQEEPDFGS